MDLGTGLTIFGSALSSAKLIEKLLGPSADYIGKGICNWTQRRIENVSRILTIATNRLGDRINSEGTVPPRILQDILDQGSYVEDELSAEYFGGLLASSRSDNVKDDRAHYYIEIVTKLTTYQIRTHYVFYTTLKRLFDGEKINLALLFDQSKAGVFIPFSCYIESLDLSNINNWKSILNHCMNGLEGEDLILAKRNAWGEKEFLRSVYRFDLKNVVNDAGIIFFPSSLGVELFLWVNGLPDTALSDFLLKETVIRIRNEITFPKGPKKLLLE